MADSTSFEPSSFKVFPTVGPDFTTDLRVGVHFDDLGLGLLVPLQASCQCTSSFHLGEILWRSD